MENEVKCKKLPRLRLPIVVEGRYDKSAILSMYRATVITTDGFGVFNSREKQALIRRIAADGVIVLTDSDGGGRQIRGFLSGLVPKDRIYQLYIPEIEGKERRKARASRAGLLGVEGVGGDVLRELLDPFTADGEYSLGGISAADLYSLGLSGAEDSAALRDELCKRLSLPTKMSAKALLAALNIITDLGSLREIMEKMT